MKDLRHSIANPAGYQDMRAEAIRLLDTLLHTPVIAGTTIAETLVIGQQLNTAARILDGSLTVSEVKLTIEE